jgi:hypothetical protein
MLTGRISSRPLLRDTLLALLTVALIFLNFGHAAVSASGDFRITPDSWCGDPLLPNSTDHAPCHACRIGGGADLPPPPASVEWVAFVVLEVSYFAPVAAMDVPVHARPAQPRGPPALA